MTLQQLYFSWYNLHNDTEVVISFDGDSTFIYDGPYHDIPKRLLNYKINAFAEWHDSGYITVSLLRK